MRHERGSPLTLMGLAILLVGCGGPEADAARQTVASYLEACRTGNADQAEALLSARARQQTQEAGVDVTFARSDTAQFDVGKAKLREDATAEVASTWTDEGESHAIYWALREEAGDWRIIGMAADESRGGSPTIWLDFEDPTLFDDGR